MKCKIHNNANYEGLSEIAENLYNFAHKRFNFSKPAIIVFESNVNNVGKLFAPTGYYEPQTGKIVVYVDHRHPKDILRSLAHELIHHKQNCEGQFGVNAKTGPGYAQKDQHMREMEGDAYRTGNIMLFRDWEDNYKQGRNLMNENLEQIEEKKGEKGPYSKEREGFDKDLDGVPDGADEDADDPEVQEEQKISDKEWYQNQLHEALLKKFNIKK